MRPRPGDWIVWETRDGGTQLGRSVGRVGGGSRRAVVPVQKREYRLKPCTGRYLQVQHAYITTVIRTGKEGELQKIVELLQHERPDIREMAFQAIAEHTGERLAPAEDDEDE